jgi:hypothetical protein
MAGDALILKHVTSLHLTDWNVHTQQHEEGWRRPSALTPLTQEYPDSLWHHKPVHLQSPVPTLPQGVMRKDGGGRVPWHPWHRNILTPCGTINPFICSHQFRHCHNVTDAQSHITRLASRDSPLRHENRLSDHFSVMNVYGTWKFTHSDNVKR